MEAGEREISKEQEQAPVPAPALLSSTTTTMRKDTLKRKIMAGIEKLPEGHLPKVFDLVEKLKAKQKAQKLPLRPKKKLDPAKNPLRGLIGIADVEPFAHKIDEELYGKEG